MVVRESVNTASGSLYIKHPRELKFHPYFPRCRPCYFRWKRPRGQRNAVEKKIAPFFESERIKIRYRKSINHGTIGAFRIGINGRWS